MVEISAGHQISRRNRTVAYLGISLLERLELLFVVSMLNILNLNQYGNAFFLCKPKWSSVKIVNTEPLTTGVAMKALLVKQSQYMVKGSICIPVSTKELVRMVHVVSKLSFSLHPFYTN